MSEMGIVTDGALGYRRQRVRLSSVKRCASCNGDREHHRFDRRAGFCPGCLERSRPDVDDDLGGES